MKLRLTCDWCGQMMERTPSHVHRHNFCCRECLAAFSSRKQNPDKYNELKDYTNMSIHCAEMAKQYNPSRMTPEVREKLSQARLDTGQKRSYRKLHGRHEHRAVAEKMLGRSLRDGEVVHHMDGNKRNNSPDNLMVFASQKEHAEYHMRLYKFFMNGGDAQ